MKKNVLLIIAFCFSINIFSQDSIVNYLNFKFKKCPKETALYTQTIVKKESLWQGIVYYANGKIKFDGNYLDKKLRKKVGIFRTFNEKGNLKSVQNYNLKGKKEGVYLYFSDKGDQVTKGLFQNGKKEGVWKYSDENKNKSARVIFKKGKIIAYKLWDENGSELNEELVLYKKPIYRKGVKFLNAKLKKELLSDLKKKGLKTNFIVKLDVNSEGIIKDVSIVPELKEFYEKNIAEFFYNLKGIEPAIVTNRKVAAHLEIPVIVK